jgi:hypothetical protein
VAKVKNENLAKWRKWPAISSMSKASAEEIMKTRENRNRWRKPGISIENMANENRKRRRPK